MHSYAQRYEKLKLDTLMLITVEGSSSSVSPGKVLEIHQALNLEIWEVECHGQTSAL